MQLSLNQLNIHLNNSLSPIYLISGDELLCVQDARDDIVNAAKRQGFSEKNILHVDAQFNASTLLTSLQTHHLFSEKVIIDVRNAIGKFDTQTATILEKYALHSRDDRLLIITTDKLSSATQKSSWCETLKRVGVYLPIWPVKINVLPQWILNRAKKYNITLSDKNARLLAYYCEGNLLSARQVLEKLNLLYSGTEITETHLRAIVSDHAHFGIFDLQDAIAQNNVKKTLRILKKLEQSGEEPALVLWAIHKQLRDSFSEKYKNALQYAAYVDEIIKSGKTEDVWRALLMLVMQTR